jgi:hypothetical protein
MSLESLSDGWKRFGEGRRWRCIAPRWSCEVDREGNIPAYLNLASSVNLVRRVRAYYQGKHFTSMTDENGNLADILTANAMTESFGTVPTPFSRTELENVLKGSNAGTPEEALAAVVDYIASRARFLVRKEPGYAGPVSTPDRISVGAHHMLLSTGLEMQNLSGARGNARTEAITGLVTGLAADSAFAAELALTYFSRRRARHQLEPPLMAAVYNAGSLRPSSKNPWNLVQYGEHIDRWVAYYNTSRSLASAQAIPSVPSDPPGTPAALELRVSRTIFTERSTIGELYVDGTLHCHTLEDRVRSGGVKVYGETAIPAGRYEVIITYSNHFKKELPLLLNVPNYEGVRIHAGNTAADTLGCILVGKSKGEDRIWDCKPVFDSLMEKIRISVPAKKCFITIGS